MGRICVWVISWECWSACWWSDVTICRSLKPDIATIARRIVLQMIWLEFCKQKYYTLFDVKQQNDGKWTGHCLLSKSDVYFLLFVLFLWKVKYVLDILRKEKAVSCCLNSKAPSQLNCALTNQRNPRAWWLWTGLCSRGSWAFMCCSMILVWREINSSSFHIVGSKTGFSVT